MYLFPSVADEDEHTVDGGGSANSDEMARAEDDLSGGGIKFYTSFSSSQTQS
jgi:hypothetical protein